LDVFWPLFAFFFNEDDAPRSDFLPSNAPGAARLLVKFQFEAPQFDPHFCDFLVFSRILFL